MREPIAEAPMPLPSSCPSCGCNDWIENMVTARRTFVCGLVTDGATMLPRHACDAPEARQRRAGGSIESFETAVLGWFALCVLAGLAVGFSSGVH